MSEMTDAQRMAELLNEDGQHWATADGRTLFNHLIREFGADMIYSARDGHDEQAQRYRYRECRRGEPVSDDPVRYLLPDGFVIVEAGDGWDYEGSAPSSRAGTE